MKLFVDHNISFRVARAAHAIYEPDHQAVALRDKFSADISDVEYIQALDAEGGWAVLTLDNGIRNRPAERAALLASKLTFFFLAPGWQAFTVPETSSAADQVVAEDGAILRGRGGRRAGRASGKSRQQVASVQGVIISSTGAPRRRRH